MQAARRRPSDPDELAAYKETNDPLEPMNRYFFEVNYGLDQLLFKPVAAWYNLILPAPVEQGVHNFLTNLNSPVIFANDAMQGNGPRAGVTAKRFLINSTLGVAGIFDVAADWWGMKHHDEDFGQTLAVWGVGEGPYLVAPVLGPSNPRDLTGIGVDGVMDPWGWVLPSHLMWINYTRTGRLCDRHPGAQSRHPRSDPQGLAGLLRHHAQPLPAASQ